MRSLQDDTAHCPFWDIVDRTSSQPPTSDYPCVQIQKSTINFHPLDPNFPNLPTKIKNLAYIFRTKKLPLFTLFPFRTGQGESSAQTRSLFQPPLYPKTTANGFTYIPYHYMLTFSFSSRKFIGSIIRNLFSGNEF